MTKDLSRPLQAVIFDCDGILVDTEPLHYRAFQEVLRPLGMGFDYDHYMDVYIGFDDRDAFAQAFREKGETLSDSHLARLMEAKHEVLQSIVAQGVSSFPGVLELIGDLQRHQVPLGVASGALRSEIEAFTTVLSIRDAFGVIVAADDVARSKPDPETYLEAVKRMRALPRLSDLVPSQCLAIEDTPAGIASAKGAGLYVVAVTNSFPEENLGEAHLVLPSLEELTVGRMMEHMEEFARKGFKG